MFRLFASFSLFMVLAGAIIAQGNKPVAGKIFPPVVATVNGESVSGADLESIMSQLSKNGDPKIPPQARIQMEKDSALAMLIDDMLMQQFIRQYTAPVKDLVINQKMAEMVGELKKQGKTLQDLCKESQQTEEQLKKTLRLKLQWQNHAQAQFKEEQVKGYYNHFKDFFDGNTVQVGLIAFRTPPGISPAEKAALVKKMQDLRKFIVEGKMDFTVAAKTYSQDPSNVQGGNLGYIPRKYAMEEPMAQAAFRLGAGQVSDVIALDMGVFLLKVFDRKPGRPSDYNQIKNDVREFCLEDYFQDTLMQQRKAGKIEVLIR